MTNSLKHPPQVQSNSLKYILRPLYYRIRHRYWELFGRPYEVMNHKRRYILDKGHRYECSTFVETGSYLGDTIEVSRQQFEKVLSVELSEQLYSFCSWRFRKDSNVSLFLGDSSQVLPQMLDLIDGRALFWLDGHYSGGSTALGKYVCPLIFELAAIAKHKRNDHIILIDDARLFGVDPGYPTLQEAQASLLLINSNYQISVVDDIICAVL